MSKSSIKYDNRNIYRTAKLLRIGILKRSKSYNIDCENLFLTTEYFYNRLLNNDNCECCSVKLDFSTKKFINNRSPTVDRIIPENGYIITNIAILCWRCNIIKAGASLGKLKLLLKWMKHEV